MGLGPHHLEVALRGYEVGNVHFELGHLLPAESYYRRAYAICNRDRKANPFLHASISKQLGIILARSERALQAEPFLLEALELMQICNQAESKDALDVLQELAMMQTAEKNYAMAWQFFLSAIALASKKEMLDVLTAEFYDAFNQCAAEVQQEQLAESIYQQTLNTLEGSLTNAAELANLKLGELQRLHK
jgi:tetratricopeptide (TPR) repeat protein